MKPFRFKPSRMVTAILVTTILTSNLAFAEECVQPQTNKKYYSVGCLTEGLAPVGFNKDTFGVKWGYVNKRGKEVIPLKYDFVMYFGEGIAPVKLNGKWGYIDKKMNEVLSFKYDSAISFSEGIAPIKLNDKWG